MKQRLLESPLLPALAAHALAWVATLFFLYEYREDDSPLTKYVLFVPVVLTAGALFCTVMRVGRIYVWTLSWILLAFAILGAMTIGMFLAPLVLFLFLTAARMR